MVQSLPWASGRKKTAPGSRGVAKRRRSRRPTSVASIVWALITLALGVTLLVVQGTLLLIFTALSVLVTALSVLADQTRDPATVPAPRPKARQSAVPRGTRSSKPGSSSVPKCTKTGQPIDNCGCAQRHVASSDGADRYKRNIGDPLTGKAGGKKVRATASSPNNGWTPERLAQVRAHRPKGGKSSWYDDISGTKCRTCKGTGAGETGACGTCRGFGKVV